MAARRNGLRRAQRNVPLITGSAAPTLPKVMRRSGRCLANQLRVDRLGGSAADSDVCSGDCSSHLARRLRDTAVNTPDRQALNRYTEASAPNELHKWEGHMADDIAATGGPEPMALLIATSESLLLSSTRGTFKIPRNAVTKLGKGKFYPWFFSAVRIHHSVREFPRDLQFKPLRGKPAEVMNALRTLGYPVA
jgi:hypothetical protein